MRAEALPELLSTPHQLDPTLGARGPEPRGALRRVDQQACERREAPRAVVRVQRLGRERVGERGGARVAEAVVAEAS